MAPYNSLGARAVSNLCTTPDCIHIASEILGNLALNYNEIDPCTDFDTFACGNWAVHNSLSVSNNGYDSLFALGTEISATAKQIVEGKYPTGADAGWISVNLTDDQVKADKENFNKLQNAYRTCISYKTLEAEGLKPLAEFVNNIVQLFPATESSNQTKYDYSDAMGKTLALFESLGVETTQSMIISPYVYNRNENILSITAMTPDATALQGGPDYVQMVSALISAVHPDNLTEKQIQTLVAAALELKAKLGTALALAQAEIASGTETGPTSLSEIHKIAPQFNFEYVVNQLAPKGYKGDKIEAALNYYKNASEIISKTPANVLQTFFVWKAVSALSSYVEAPETNEFTSFQTDAKSLAPRWQDCVQFVDTGVNWLPESNSGAVGPTGLTWILARFYADKKYSPEANDQLNEIAEYLEEAFLKRVEGVDWATSDVKKAVAEKVQAIDKRIALLTEPDACDPIEIKKYYAEVNITNSHLGNALALANAHIKKKWGILGKPYQKGWFSYSSLTTNAFYDPVWNSITMLLGVLEYPNYSVGMPSYIAYGGLGSAVGHEITHGFDTRGRLFDKNGNETKWWDDKSIDAYNKKTECFVEQYSKYTLTASNGTKVPIDGENTLMENIADAGGLVSSFLAWKKWDSDKGKAKNLPGLDKFTHEQLFFIKWGQTWCNALPKDYQIQQMAGGEVHSPNEARNNVALKNSAEFLKAFNCPAKKPVCELW